MRTASGCVSACAKLPSTPFQTSTELTNRWPSTTTKMGGDAQGHRDRTAGGAVIVAGRMSAAVADRRPEHPGHHDHEEEDDEDAGLVDQVVDPPAVDRGIVGHAPAASLER